MTTTDIKSLCWILSIARFGLASKEDKRTAMGTRSGLAHAILGFRMGLRERGQSTVPISQAYMDVRLEDPFRLRHEEAR